MRLTSLFSLLLCALVAACGTSTPGKAKIIPDTDDAAIDVSGDDGATGDDVDLSGMAPADDAGGCGLRTCASANANCGPIGDGCGGVVQCGTCAAPQLCGGSGVANQCGGMSCKPRTCADLGLTCGPGGDGCGNLIMCGNCPAGQTCGGGGTPGKCGMGGIPNGGMVCTPKTCAQLGFNCGPAGDECGNMLNCGTCPAGQGCGVGGKPAQCGQINLCVPATCASLGFNCGMAGDGCGGVINCGSCPLPDICGGAGAPNQCGGGVMVGGCVNLCKQQMTCPVGTTTVSGVVLAPTDPLAGYGQPDPIFNALVYIPNAPVKPFAAGVSCDKCGAEASGSPLVSVITGPDGKFTLTNAPCGANIPLVIQVGRWRRQIVIPQVTCCANTALSSSQTRLPRNHNEGDIPLIAIVTGGSDPIECVLPKIGIDNSEYSLPSGTGRVRFYIDNGADLGFFTPAAFTLWSNPSELAKYDMVIADCTGTPTDQLGIWQQNVINYTNAGGRLFASHYSYVWLYNDAPFSSTAQWDADQTFPSDLNAFVDQTFPKGMALATWLFNVKASAVQGQIAVQQVRHDFDGVIAPSQRWLYADPNLSPQNPVEYTFNTPVGVPSQQQCGRVLFSDFHVNTGGNATGGFPGECGGASPMTAQEKVLEFMLFDLGSCIQPDVPQQPKCYPLTCAQQKANCGPVGDGCGNIIQCGACPAGQTCGGGGVPSQCGGGQCAPLTCKSQNINCGPAGDGCNNLLQCGACPVGQTCGGGGVPGQCGAADLLAPCAGHTCKDLGLKCGPAGDGCGNVIDCGKCPMGQTCGGGGVPGECGAPKCMPQTCAQVSATCGLIGDGCGGVVDCGPCPADKTCGGAGVPNVCAGVI